MSLLERLHAMPTQGVALPFQGFIRYRESSNTQIAELIGESIEAKAPFISENVPLVLLHGIGSGSGSWLHQLTNTSLGRVLAWDAPGYADSSALKIAEPVAADYAAVLWAWLDALQIKEVHLVGHSLGCIIAASGARMQSQRVKALTLLAPAQGYGAASEDVRIKKRDERLRSLEKLGVEAMAEQRAPRLLSPQARPEQIAIATHMMSRLNAGGYTQATHMLSTADIRTDLQAFRKLSAAPIQVACGDQDVITPPQACRDLAALIQAPYTALPNAGHMCPLEAAALISPLLSQGIAHA